MYCRSLKDCQDNGSIFATVSDTSTIPQILRLAIYFRPIYIRGLEQHELSYREVDRLRRLRSTGLPLKGQVKIRYV